MSVTSEEVNSTAAPVKASDDCIKNAPDEVDEVETLNEPPVKLLKLDVDTPVEEVTNERTTLESTEQVKESNNTVLDATAAEPIVANGANVEQSESHKEPENNKKTYRLIIYIDKIRSKPRPRSKKFPFLKQRQRAPPQYLPNDAEIDGKDRFSEGNEQSTCIGGCILRESNTGGRSTVKCICCKKRYPPNQIEIQEKTNSNLMRHKPLSLLQSSYSDLKKHLICDMCETECSTRVTYDKHVRMHVSTDPLFPYKCHKCPEIFEAKEDVRQHCFIMHPVIKLQNTVLQVTASPMTPQTSRQKDYRCISCNITFRNEHAFRNHINSHTKKEGLRCGISDASNIIPVPNPLTGSQIGILRAIKFTCRVCSKEFDNVGEVDKHTRTHLADAEEEHKCNICKKTYRSSTQLNEHVKHHFSCAHHCPICSKTFVNKTTLKAHLKTHSEHKALLST